MAPNSESECPWIFLFESEALWFHSLAAIAAAQMSSEITGMQ